MATIVRDSWAPGDQSAEQRRHWHPPLWLVVAAMAIAPLAACGGEETPAGAQGGTADTHDADLGDAPSPPCKVAADCPNSLDLCVKGACRLQIACKSDKQCVDSDQTCDHDLGRCVQCLVKDDCPKGELCMARTCIPPATPCTTSKQCAADQICDKAEGRCVNCIKDDACDDLEYCFETVCTPDRCDAASALCLDDSLRKVCLANGSGWTTEACAAGSSCKNGACVPAACKPGSKVCADSATLATCKASGEGYDNSPCGQGKVCNTGACWEAVCAPNQTSCSGTKVLKCNMAGTAEETVEDCATKNNACLQGTTCTNGACGGGEPVLCDDGNPCTVDTCDTTLGCLFTAIAAPCSDGDPCTAGDKCANGKCKAGLPTICDDSKACTKDSCNGTGGCNHQPISGPCGTGGTCKPDGTCCIPQCNGKVCGSDGCGGSCGSCDSGSSCTYLGTCIASTCPGVSYQGCCDAAGVLKYCEDNSIHSENCASSGKTCGWSAVGAYYTCAGNGADPGGQYPLECQSVCKPQTFKACCGNNLCWYDSCGSMGATAETCAFGCDGALKKCSADACQGIPPAGACLPDGKTIVSCVKAAEQGTSQLVYSACNVGAKCAVQSGKAVCQLEPWACMVGTSICDAQNPNKRLVCGKDAKWAGTPCDGCTNSAAGPLCKGSVATKPYTATFRYEYKTINAQKTDWSQAISLAPLAGAMAAVERTNPDGTLQWLEVGTTDAQGKVTLQVPDPPYAGDRMRVVAAQPAPGGGYRFAVVAPDIGTGEQDAYGVKVGSHVAWSWAIVPEPAYDNSVWTISIDDGSGAARLFDQTRRVVDGLASVYGKPGLPLVVWAGPETSWDCGACFTSGFDVKIGNASFSSHVWMPWTAGKEWVWADSVTAHELGHWAMESYGAGAVEGGTHYLVTPTFPGQAWSEGFATWLSSMTRGSPLQARIEDGGVFWFDIAAKDGSDGFSIVPAKPGDGILQKMDEVLVSAMLWQISAKSGPTVPMLLPANKVFFSALASPRMTVPPYARGYTRHTWTTTSAGVFEDVVDTGESAPMFADFADALLCAGFDKVAMQGAVAAYPYVASQPKCGVGGAP